MQALAAVADVLRASPGRWFFGDKPCSLDALLFGHLAFYKHSPVAAPVLRDKVREGGGLGGGVAGGRWVVLVGGGLVGDKMGRGDGDGPKHYCTSQ